MNGIEVFHPNVSPLLVIPEAPDYPRPAPRWLTAHAFRGLMKKIVYLLSDSTGETVARVGAAALSLFNRAVDKRLRVFIRSEAEADAVIDEFRREPGAVIVTMVNPDLRERIMNAAETLGLPAFAVLQPVVGMLEAHLGETAKPLMGGQYVVDDLYYRRIDAIDYAISHDDGALTDRLARADVILTGVSRTSKTPTCIYLAVRGVKAANLPLVPGANPPPAFFSAISGGVPVVALTASPARLAQIRSHRLEAIGHDRGAEYAALEMIRREVADARLLFERIGAPVIDVTRRSIEETAAEIMAILRKLGRA
ncbi:pyruvate, water dikinase regulatory protein [Pikeienuella piscinae]|nr:pyruvate, water dikinase regulatory protein [Pikeienuella piscinae]